MRAQAKTRVSHPLALAALLSAIAVMVAVGVAVLRHAHAAGRGSAAAASSRAAPPGPTGVDSLADEPRNDSSESGLDVVHLQVEHTLFYPMENVVLQVERMNGRMIGEPGRIISLDDVNSFSVHIDQAVTRLSATDLSALINNYLLRQADSAVRHVDVSFDGQQVVVKGRVHKLLTLPFQGRGVISATSDGELRMHMEEFRVAGMLNRSFLALFGVRLDTVAQPRRKASFRVEGDDFITSLNDLFPPPRVYGRLTRVHIEQQNLVQTIGIQPVPHAIDTIPKALPEPPNYIYFTGGRMRFGRVTMDNVDLKLVDQTPQDPFDFSLDHYQEQIEAGHVQVLPSLGLVVYAGDWHALAAQRQKGRASPAPAHP